MWRNYLLVLDFLKNSIEVRISTSFVCILPSHCEIQLGPLHRYDLDAYEIVIAELIPEHKCNWLMLQLNMSVVKSNKSLSLNLGI